MITDIIHFKNPDLHIHSDFSDGTDSPEEILRKVKENNIDIFSLTDHDSYGGCKKIFDALTYDDPYFISGVEFSCRDEKGKYHILGYNFNIEDDIIKETVNYTHNLRKEKTRLRIAFIENKYNIKLSEVERKRLLSLKNAGKPHFAELMCEKRLVQNREEAFNVLSLCKIGCRELTPDEAIDAILKADGIPVLAHGILENGTRHLSYDEIDKRVFLLKQSGLMGLECYYSGYSGKEEKIMLDLAKKYNMIITAGSDYHGENKKIKIGDTNNPDYNKMEEFYKSVLKK